MDRQKIIVRTSVIGILANVFLAAFKAAVGLLANSISVVLDAVNNLSDALSSVITIIGAKLSVKPADKKHPLGYGRIEYLSSVIIAVIVLYAGISAAVESVKKIITPEAPDYSTVSLIIIAVAVLVKILLSTYVSRTGRKVNSDSLIASGKDALMDSIISASVLVAAVIYLIWGVSLEAYLGVIISIFIIKSGFEILRETISRILGERIDSELSKEIKKDLCAYDEVKGAYDLILHSYGPDKLIGSVHIEVDENMNAKQLDMLERRIAEKVYAETGVAMTGIGLYARVTDTPFSEQVFADLREIIKDNPAVLQLHGFAVDEAEKQIRFDLVINYNEKNREAIFQNIVVKISEKYPTYKICPVLDADITDF